MSNGSHFIRHDVTEIAGDLRVIGQESRKRRVEGLSVELKSETDSHDVVTQVDRLCSEVLKRSLGERLGVPVVSEEDHDHDLSGSSYVLLDPLDGTDGYSKGQPDWGPQAGLIVDGQPAVGWVYLPDPDELICGGPKLGVWRSSQGGDWSMVPRFTTPLEHPVRLGLGARDRKVRPHLSSTPGIEVIPMGGVGYKLLALLNGKIQVMANPKRGFKVWDTAPVVAIALALGLEVGTIGGHLSYTEALEHQHPVVIGLRGCVKWANTHLL